MTKRNFNSEQFINQEKMVIHNGFPIGHPDFDMDDSFDNRIDKIRAIAGLFQAELLNEGRRLDNEECWGVSNILKEAAEDLRNIYYHIVENKEAAGRG